jgi:hypothetical protein
MHHTSRFPSAFDRITSAVARVPLDFLVAAVGLIGVAVFTWGIFAEIAGEQQIRLLHGSHGVALYLASLKDHAVDNLFDYFHYGLYGTLPSFGGTLQARGILIAYAGSAVAASVVLAARWHIARRAVRLVRSTYGFAR